MKLFIKIIVLCGYLELVSSVPTKTHPPVWEYTYQYELFEKIYRQVQFLLTDVRILSNKLSDRQCPQNWKTGNSKCYYLVFYRKLNWFQSQEACERLGGHLAVFESEQEDTTVSDYLNGLLGNEKLTPNNIWIGGFRYSRDVSWRWVTGGNVSYVNWEPDSGGSETGGRHCVALTGQHWNAHRCSKDLYYLCEKQPVLYWAYE